MAETIPERMSSEILADKSSVTTLRRRRAWLTGLLVLALLAAAVAAGLTGREVQHRRHSEAADRSALEAGRTAAMAFTSYDYRNLDKDLKVVQDLATGTFRTQFSAALSALTKAIQKAHGVSVGRVLQAGLVSRHGSDAVIDAAVDAEITNVSTPRPTTRRYRLQITLSRASGTWLISEINPVA